VVVVAEGDSDSVGDNVVGKNVVGKNVVFGHTQTKEKEKKREWIQIYEDQKGRHNMYMEARVKKYTYRRERGGWFRSRSG
jgi:hypothetical protein